MPVVTTSLYFVVFGSAIGSRMTDVSSVPYGAFIVPGLMMLTMFTESISNASFGIYMPKWTGTIYEMLSAPLSPLEMVVAYVGAAATKSVIIGAIIFATAHLFVDIQVAHPLLMRSEEHTSELQSLMRISYAVFCLKKKQHSHSTYLSR